MDKLQFLKEIPNNLKTINVNLNKIEVEISE